MTPALFPFCFLAKGSWRRKYHLLFFCIFTFVFSAQSGVVLNLGYKHPLLFADGASSLGQPDLARPCVDGLKMVAEGEDRYGTCTRGYIEAPETGRYVFFLASDGPSEFWLSSNERSSGLVKIAENETSVAPGDYYANSLQRSAAIRLVKGDRYYFELFHNEVEYKHHVSVGWQLPNGTLEKPISSSHLLPLPVDESGHAISKSPRILTRYWGTPVTALTNIFAVERSPVTFGITVEGTLPVSIQWFRNGHPLSGETLSTCTLRDVKLSNNGDVLSVIVSNRLGMATAQAILSISAEAAAPVVTSVLNLGLSNRLAVLFSKPVAPVEASKPENYLVDGAPAQKVILTGNPQCVMIETLPLRATEKHYLKIKRIVDTSKPSHAIIPNSIEVENGLKTWLRFDDVNTTNLVDSSGNSEPAFLAGDCSLSGNGKIGGCLVLGGGNGHVQLPTGMNDFKRGLTISIWAKPKSIRSWSRFVDLGNGEHEDNILFGRFTNSTALFLQVYRSESVQKTVLADNALDLNTWQHFAATMDSNGNATIYRNGAVISEGVVEIPRSITRIHNYLGRSNWNIPNDQYYDGAIDDLRIYDRPLAAAEIKVLAAGGLNLQ